ncbi:MAG: hypothetical protein V4517_27975 [Pseudomonadota bacterium]
MTIPATASPKRRLQILDDETRDAPRFNPDAQGSMSAAEDLWVKDFMSRLSASVRSLGRRRA